MPIDYRSPRRRLACRLALAFGTLSPLANAQVALLASDPQVLVFEEALRIQFAGRAAVVTLEPRSAEAAATARGLLHEGKARVVAWIAAGDEPDPETGDYLVSVARALPDGPGIEVVRLQAQRGALGDRALSLRVAELYPTREVKPAALPKPPALPDKPSKRSPVRAARGDFELAVLARAQPNLVPVSPGLLLGYRIRLGALRLVPELSGWWVPTGHVAKGGAELSIGGWGVATGMALLRHWEMLSVGGGVELQWHAWRAQGVAANRQRGSVVEWVPGLVPNLTVGLETQSPALYVAVSGGLSWAFVQQTFRVGGLVMREEPRFGPQGRLSAGALF